MDETEIIVKGIALFVGLIVIALVFFGSVYTINSGDRGLILTWGKISSNIQQPGIHFKIPIMQSLVVMSVRTQTITFDNKQSTGTDSEYTSLATLSSDQQDVALATIVNYHLEDKDLVDIYIKYGDMITYQGNILEPIIRDIVKAQAAQYSALEINTKRAEYEAKVSDILSKRFEDKFAVFDRLSTTNVEYTKEFTDSINAKVVASQNALASQYKLDQAKLDAQSLTVQGQAIEANPQILQKEAIDKWNGVLPLVTGGGSIPFINFGGILGGNSSK